MSLNGLVTIANVALASLRRGKASMVWFSLILICGLAVSSGYCVTLSVQHGFEFAKCAGP